MLLVWLLWMLIGVMVSGNCVWCVDCYCAYSVYLLFGILLLGCGVCYLLLCCVLFDYVCRSGLVVCGFVMDVRAACLL